LVEPDLFWSIRRLDGVVTAVVAVEPASAHSTVLRKDAAMGHRGGLLVARAFCVTWRRYFAFIKR